MTRPPPRGRQFARSLPSHTSRAARASQEMAACGAIPLLARRVWRCALASADMAIVSLKALRAELRALAEPAVRVQQVRVLTPADDDQLLGVRVPTLRKLAHAHRALTLDVVSTLALIHEGRFQPTFHLALTLCRDPEPLIHKALGWMLREIGRRDAPLIVQFLDQHLAELPRITVRHATERLPPG